MEFRASADTAGMRENTRPVVPSVTSCNLAAPGEPDTPATPVIVPVNLCNLPPFPAIANQVLVLSADPEIDMKKIASVMEADPAFAAEVLLVANSALFGFPSKMHVLRHAIAVLGLDRVKALAVTVAIRGFLGTPGPLIRQCWRHSAACAVIAEEISPILRFSGDRAFTASIMHDIGRLGLLKTFSREMALVLGGQYDDAAQVLGAECAAVDIDHTRAGGWLVKHWALPQAFIDICEHHHDPLQSADSPLLQLVKLACRIADCIGYSAAQYRRAAGYPELLSHLPSNLPASAFPDELTLRDNVEIRLAPFEH